MTTIQVTIGPTSASPGEAPLKHTDRVEFVLSDRPDSVTLTFTDASPLALLVDGQMTNPNSVTLNSSLTVQDFGIDPFAPKGKYPYSFPQYGVPPQQGSKVLNAEQPTTSGELEVTTDPEPHR